MADATLSDYEDLFEELDESWAAEESNGSDESACPCGIPSTEDLTECSNVSCMRLFHRGCRDLGHLIQPNTEQQSLPNVRPPSSSTGSRLPLPVSLLCHKCVSSSSQATETESSGQHPVVRDATGSGASSSANDSSSKTRRKDKMIYPEKRFHMEDFAAGHFFKAALLAVKDQPSLQIKTSETLKVRLLTDSVIQISKTEEFNMFASQTEQDVWDVIKQMQGVAWTETCKVEMWHRFHLLRCSEELLFKWHALQNHFGISREQHTETMLLQIILKLVHKDIISELVKCDGNVSDMDEQVAEVMEEHEAQALRYCAGYIPFKLIKKYRKMQNSGTARQFVDVLGMWSEQQDQSEDNGFLNYTKDWINRNDRGGLFHINDKTFRFFQTLENVLKAKISTRQLPTCSQLNIKSYLLNEFTGNKFVTLMWGKICQGLSAEMSGKLMEEVLLCFIKMRINAFLRVVVMIKKASTKSVSKKGEKSLRKELN